MLGPEEAWMAHAACRAHPELGWTKDSHDVGLGETATMSVICGGCPVPGDCAGFVTREDITSGFWAGEHRDLDHAADVGGAA
jgi:hypothetical protein